jgi:hypothetical protein
MALRRHHYERALEDYLRRHRTPYVAVDEARKALVPWSDPGHSRPAALDPAWGGAGGGGGSLKSFDFVIYSTAGPNLLADVKGRRAPRSARPRDLPPPRRPPRRSAAAPGAVPSWVTEDDVESLRRWQDLFGPGFRAAFVFVYWCDRQPPDGAFGEVFEHGGKWYAVRVVPLDEYASAMKPRSPRWRTVHVPGAEFERLGRPLRSECGPPPAVAASKPRVPNLHPVRPSCCSASP